MIKDLYKIGFVKCTHGLKGQLELKLLVHVNMYEFLSKHLFVRLDGLYKPLVIDEIMMKKTNFVIKFKNLNNINEVKKYLKAPVFLSEKDILDSSFKKKEYIIGFSVVNYVTNKIIGKITTVNDYPKNKTFSFFHSSDNKIIIVPFIDQFVYKVDYESKKIYIKLIEGL